MIRKPYGKIKNPSEARRKRRALGVRKKVAGTAERPRICATKSNKNLYVQVIDDVSGKTLLSAQTFGKNAVSGAVVNVEGAKLVGKDLADKMKGSNLNTAVFDRAGYKYTGVIAALVDSMRENGIQI